MNKLPLQSDGLSVILLSCCSNLTELKLTVPQISSLFGESKDLPSTFLRILAEFFISNLEYAKKPPRKRLRNL